MSKIILGFDPGRDKCGIAVRQKNGQICHHEVVSSQTVISTIESLINQYSIDLLIMGNQTTAKQWKQSLETQLSSSISIIMIDERNSSLEARDRYWEMYPPKGITRLIPQGMRVPPRPIDDIVAILLIERYLNYPEKYI
ncbi:MAG TPA: resolvase [Cyanothece sp. UBA12306]|nr:resolvase [Cyanothece sp. UBA12306]